MNSKTSTNRVPRKFHHIVATMLIDTNCDKAGDTVKIQRFPDKQGFWCTNLRTGLTSYAFGSFVVLILKKRGDEDGI